jgi:anti-sigma B factor antagonist
VTQEIRPLSPSSQPCGVEAHDLGDRTVLRFAGPQVALDETNTGIVGEHLLALVGGLKAGRFELDFGNVTYLNSSALGLLLRLRKALHARGGRLLLCHLAPQVYEVFKVTRLHTLFDIRQSERAADGAGRSGPATPPRSPDAPRPVAFLD